MTSTEITTEVLDHFGALITNDYVNFSKRSRWNAKVSNTDAAAKWPIEFEKGSKFIRVVVGKDHGRSVHSFIALSDGPFYKKGDVLKAASWKTPAKNFTRGSVFDPEDRSVRWTGAT